MISLEKKIALPISVPVFLNSPSLDNLLNFSIPISRAFWSSTTNNPSTITTAPSIMIPKSTAPMLNRFAFIPFKRMHIKANNNDSGITMLTVTVVRQSAIKIKTIKVTKRIPSKRL